jgi:uncharacterized protein (TIGR03086 family)
MTESSEPLALLARALDQAGAIIARVSPDQATLPTPCRSWDVRALVNHVVQDVQQFIARASGAEWKPEEKELIGDDWAAAYRHAAAKLLAAWRREGALDRTLQLPIGEVPATWMVNQQIADFAVHAWDVARATGQSTSLDQDVGRLALEWGRQNLQPRFRGDEGSGKVFGPEVSVPQDAPLYNRLADFFGRDPR